MIPQYEITIIIMYNNTVLYPIAGDLNLNVIRMLKKEFIMIIISLQVTMELYLPRKVVIGDKGIGTGGHRGQGPP